MSTGPGPVRHMNAIATPESAPDAGLGAFTKEFRSRTGSRRVGERDRFSFYEGSPCVKSPVALFCASTVGGSFFSCKWSVRWLARFDCECERDSLVTTFYPCRRGWPSTRCCIRPKRARRTGFGRSAPSIRTVALDARPRKISGASTNLQRCVLLCLTGLRAQISEAISRAPSGITPSAR